MKYFFSLILIFCCGLTQAQQIPSKPSPPRLVNDFAHLLMPAQADALEQKLVSYNDSTSTQVAVVIVETVGDYGMVDYAVKLGREWGVGGKEFNNGVILLVAKADHKAFIATGYGMEGALPDATCKEIVENEIIPNFRAGDFYGGLDKATDDIIAAAAGEYKAPPKKDKDGGAGGAVLLAIIFVIILVILSQRGGGGGTMMSRRGGLGMILGAMMGSSMGGRGFGGGGGFGGGSGGGGFGGFGGGGFGGGGAGGSW